MPKKRISAQIFVADGTGGTSPVEDRRFEGGDWLVALEIPAANADVWMEYLQAECSDRDWRFNSLGQMGADENSGSITVHAGPGQSREFVLVWERQRTGPLSLRARSSDRDGLPVDQVVAFVDRVNKRCQAGEKQTFYRRGYLHYEGLPWRGELWLNEQIRLGPPSRHADWLSAPQVIVVDALVQATGWQSANAAFESKVEELALFLTIVMRSNVSIPHSGHAWTWALDGETPKVELRQVGYFEIEAPSEMPRPGQYSSVPLREVARPDFALHGITGEDHERWLPADVHELWCRYADLAEERRDQFLRVARVYRIARALWREHRTASLALMVVASEALKPPGKSYDRLNIYGVVEGLLGTPFADSLKGLRFAPQRMRSAHLHRAEWLSGEGVYQIMMSTFRDPTFDEDYRVVAQVSHAAIIEWLRSGGTFVAPVSKGQRNRNRFPSTLWTGLRDRVASPWTWGRR